MGFQTTFEEQTPPSEKHNYVRYAAFKDMLESLRTKANFKKDTAGRAAFAKDFQQEVKRLTRYAASTVESLMMRIDVIHSELPSDAKDPKAQKISLYRIQDIEKSIDELGSDVLALRLFAKSNLEAFERLCSKFQDLLGDFGIKQQQTSTLDVREFTNKGLEIERLVETYLVLLSDLYARARRVKNNKEGGDAVWVPPETFQRKTTKYWVKREDILRVKFEIIKHLPLLIFGRKQGGNQDDGKKDMSFMATSCSAEESLRDAQKISSVYYDTPDLQVYHDRLLRHDFASLVRVRWYGERDQSPSFPVFVERKVHREFWTGQKSVKERCGVDQQHLQAVLSNDELPPGLARTDKNGELLTSIQAFMSDNKKGKKRQVPMVRTQYMRSAFQEATSNAVRISIDADLKMIKEQGAPRKQGDWCRDMDRNIGPKDIVDFPYVVLEVKLQDEPAPWVTELTEGAMLVAVPKFSKFQNGMALLYPRLLRNSPWWFLPDGKGGMSPANFEEMADTKDPYLKMANPAMFYDNNGKPQQAKAPAGFMGGGGDNTVARMNQLQDKLSQASMIEEINATKPLEKKKSLNKMLKSLFVSNGDGPNEYHIMCLPMTGLSRRSSAKSKRSEEAEELTFDTPRAAAIVRTRIEPKTFFANERTFLSWLQVSVIVIFMAFSLMDGSSVALIGLGGSKKAKGAESRLHASQVSGALLAPIGIAFMGYSLYMHRMRTMQILRRETVRFDDQRGPVMMVCGLGFACVVAYCISLSSIVAS
jgi:SPX domain protein involved in polyphosphate accumulation/uncharacterized membrane protein YidH (DUF202 family)